MLFNSIQFILFFLTVTSLYFILPHKPRWFLLLAASCYFYMAFVPIYILILFFTIVIDYISGIYLERVNIKYKKIFLILSIVSNVGVLALFKYYNFFYDNISVFTDSFGAANPFPSIKILLPIGLSFHTFQAMSYVIEVYRGNQKAERHFGIYALYVMFYPQLVAGPIERPQNMLHQFYEKHSFNYDDVVKGLRLILWGMFKKIVIADRLAIVVNHIYDDPFSQTGIPLIIATFFFTYQIFCDFSGYSDIAVGSAKVMGFNLMINFDRPYSASSISEFWQKWHISLSTWFKDYLYIPLGGNKVKTVRLYFNLIIVFLISGFWHGANWTFVIWGALHGMYLIIGLALKNIYSNIRTPLLLYLKPFVGKLITFFLVSFAWIFFRASDLAKAKHIALHLFDNIFFQIKTIITNNDFGRSKFLYLNDQQDNILVGCCMILFLEFIHFIQGKKGSQYFFEDKSIIVRWSFYSALLFLIVLLGVFNQKNQFIYFQF